LLKTKLIWIYLKKSKEKLEIEDCDVDFFLILNKERVLAAGDYETS
jgi:hypothetical protein